MNNMQAFLDTIAISEGTAKLGNRGYNVLVGSKLFDSYADHPRILVDLGRGLKSTAAGRYQVLERYFDSYKKLLKLPDFSPASQDEIAIQMIKEQRAFVDVNMGKFSSAVQKCSNIWASLPGAGYHQRENTLADLSAAYVKAGGVVVV